MFDTYVDRIDLICGSIVTIVDRIDLDRFDFGTKVPDTLRNSGIFNQAMNRFPGNTHLLGDSGYPLMPLVQYTHCY